ncbi:palmitoyltransferase ZDHHC4 isoform X1 [Arvicanthis niloticus]|uniref:probable palmitoyltransferase ZDHHC4 isoform X3 n=1 Tax=Arvicanthis niloticus TaxID=61156 RepID=UPI001485DA99|nr:probable palmitoyltransferase ZDHHC4 isoform X3 [Arvicanthis niloticus]XP_034345616.1 probable palmitoyltransferase ZDHHC4 isoform X3 [Arvicanthis niloticus]XP_034345617.1 probable palmitoyltransferase ZDHHC4 isoform X3 [Arvicanthis niloticus]
MLWGPPTIQLFSLLLYKSSSMDFLSLFLFYVVFLLISVVMICIVTKNQRLKAVALGAAQLCSCVTPQCLQRAVQMLLHQLFHTRHPTFVVLHLLLQGLVYVEYTCEVFGYCQELEFSLPYLLLPYLLLSVNLVFFTLTCAANPGTITKANESLLLHVYKFDDVMFPKNSRCSTCDLRKPARSKHCRVCDRCVHRFDHHCVWVNNCIGAWNTRYFLIYLLTLMASAATIAIVTAAFLLRLVAVSDLYQETYLDDLGHFQAVDTVFLIQHLFLAFPRIIFLLGFVIILSLLLAGYLCFALYLAATNQTTNEWYRGDWAWCQHWPLVAWSPSAEPQIHQNIHSHGFWSNLREIFLPATPSYKRKKK